MTSMDLPVCAAAAVTPPEPKGRYEELTAAEVLERIKQAEALLPSLDCATTTFGCDWSGAHASCKYDQARDALIGARVFVESVALDQAKQAARAAKASR